MVNCSFCGYAVQKGTGLMYVKTDGKILHFCSRKCEKNTNKLGRNPRKVLWTQENRRLRSKENKK